MSRKECGPWAPVTKTAVRKTMGGRLKEDNPEVWAEQFLDDLNDTLYSHSIMYRNQAERLSEEIEDLYKKAHLLESMMKTDADRWNRESRMLLKDLINSRRYKLFQEAYDILHG